jgi:hypothetical protein
LAKRPYTKACLESPSRRNLLREKEEDFYKDPALVEDNKEQFYEEKTRFGFKRRIVKH